MTTLKSGDSGDELKIGEDKRALTRAITEPNEALAAAKGVKYSVTSTPVALTTASPAESAICLLHNTGTVNLFVQMAIQFFNVVGTATGVGVIKVQLGSQKEGPGGAGFTDGVFINWKAGEDIPRNFTIRTGSDGATLLNTDASIPAYWEPGVLQMIGNNRFFVVPPGRTFGTVAQLPPGVTSANAVCVGILYEDEVTI